MALLLVILVADPAGFLARTPRRGLLLYLLAWAIVFPIQTAIVHFDSDPAGNDAL